MENFPFKEETYQTIGLCMEIHKVLGFGFSEIVYKDAIEFEFEKAGILYLREPELRVIYKGTQLRHRFFADFLVNNSIILEVKCCGKGIIDDHIAQVLNYLRVTENTVGLIINFGKRRLEYKRLISSQVQTFS